MNEELRIIIKHESSRTHVLRLEDVADHPVEAAVVGGDGALLGATGPDHLPPRHQHHHVADVRDVGDGPEGEVHQRLLGTEDGDVSLAAPPWRTRGRIHGNAGHRTPT